MKKNNFYKLVGSLIFLFYFQIVNAQNINYEEMEMNMFLKNLEAESLHDAMSLPFVSEIKKLDLPEENIKPFYTMKIEGRSVEQVVPALKALGYTEREILELIDDRKSLACSNSHNHDDLGNRWCHTAVVKTADGILKSYGMNSFLSGALATSIFLFKESVVDKKFSKADLVSPELSILKTKNGEYLMTLFADEAVFFVGNFRFN